MAEGRDCLGDGRSRALATPLQVPELRAGEVGYLAASIKTVADTRVGDTITLATCPASAPLPGYEEAKPMVFCGLFATGAREPWRSAVCWEGCHVPALILQVPAGLPCVRGPGPGAMMTRGNAGVHRPPPMAASDQHEALREALGKLQLSDAALSFQAEVSPAMGHGFRCGFLGLLHMEIVQVRVSRRLPFGRGREGRGVGRGEG